MSSKAAKKIRTALKAELGLTSKEVSVRAHSCGVRVTIKKAIPQKAIEEIARRSSSVTRCAFTGEILRGGNIYVNVEYDDGILESMFDLAAIEALHESGEVYKIGDKIQIQATRQAFDFMVIQLGDDNSGAVKRAWGAKEAGKLAAKLALAA